MILLCFLMLAGYVFGAVASVLSSGRGAARRWAATGAVVGAGAGLALALAVFASGVPLALEAPALLSVADGLAFRLDTLGALYPGSAHVYLTYLVIALPGLLAILLVRGA